LHQQLKKYCSVFFLFLFLFPLAEKEMHALEHSSDAHCTASDIHLHSLEHHCAICDFTITDSDKPTDIAVHFILSVSSFSFQQLTESVHTPSAFQDLPSRAPPIV
jgi:hypothetical protein